MAFKNMTAIRQSTSVLNWVCHALGDKAFKRRLACSVAVTVGDKKQFVLLLNVLLCLYAEE